MILSCKQRKAVAQKAVVRLKTTENDFSFCSALSGQPTGGALLATITANFNNNPFIYLLIQFIIIVAALTSWLFLRFDVRNIQHEKH